MNEKDELSKTVIVDAMEAGLDLNDPEVRALAKQAQIRKIKEEKEKEEKRKKSLRYKLEQADPLLLLGGLATLFSSIGGLITAIYKGL